MILFLELDKRRTPANTPGEIDGLSIRLPNIYILFNYSCVHKHRVVRALEIRVFVDSNETKINTQKQNTKQTRDGWEFCNRLRWPMTRRAHTRRNRSRNYVTLRFREDGTPIRRRRVECIARMGVVGDLLIKNDFSSRARVSAYRYRVLVDKDNTNYLCLVTFGD